MIVRCADCNAPTIRGICPDCLGDGAWHASVVLVLGLLAAAMVFHACDGHAQDAAGTTPAPLSARDRDDVARCLVAEADGHEREMVPILGVISRRAHAHGMTWGGVARGYCAVFHPASPTLTVRVLERRAAILALPGTRSAWSAHWTLALSVINAYRAGAYAEPCSELATDWGDRAGDSQRARRAGWREVACDGARLNSFWIATSRTVPADLARGRGRGGRP